MVECPDCNVEVYRSNAVIPRAICPKCLVINDFSHINDWINPDILGVSELIVSDAYTRRSRLKNYDRFKKYCRSS